jgi:hypothetical protein
MKKVSDGKIRRLLWTGFTGLFEDLQEKSLVHPVKNPVNRVH